MDAGAQGSRRRVKLPQRPRKKTEFAVSSRLAGAGAKIARHAASPRAGGQGQSLLSPRQHQPGHQGAAPPSPVDSSCTEQREREFEEDVQAVNVTPPKVGEMPIGGVERSDLPTAAAGSTPPQALQSQLGMQGVQQEQDGARADALELARGGEALLRRLADLGDANADLRRQLEHQVSEVATLEEAGRSQQQLLREFERRVEEKRHGEVCAVEARVRAEIDNREVKLRAEFDAFKEQAQKDREELLEKIRQSDGERRQREGERDEARTRIVELEAKLESVLAAPAANEIRARALEKELSLVRARFAREVDARQLAERVVADSKAQRQELKADLERGAGHAGDLQRALAEQTELAAFREEVCNDLQQRMQQQQVETEQRLLREKGKLEAVARLESILPKHVLMKALG